jgi:2-methylcitrate dehydratase PrpD
MNRSHDENHPSRALAGFVATTSSEEIPDEIVARLRRLLLDWVGITAFAGGAPVIAAALAAAERIDVDMADFYRALAVGYEEACRVAAALGAASYDRGFHTTAIAGIFGAVAATARLRGLDADATLAQLSTSALGRSVLHHGFDLVAGFLVDVFPVLEGALEDLFGDPVA